MATTQISLKNPCKIADENAIQLTLIQPEKAGTAQNQRIFVYRGSLPGLYD